MKFRWCCFVFLMAFGFSLPGMRNRASRAEKRPENMFAGRASLAPSDLSGDGPWLVPFLRAAGQSRVPEGCFKVTGVFSETGALAILPTGTWYLKPRTYLSRRL